MPLSPCHASFPTQTRLSTRYKQLQHTYHFRLCSLSCGLHAAAATLLLVRATTHLPPHNQPCGAACHHMPLLPDPVSLQTQNISAQNVRGPKPRLSRRGGGCRPLLAGCAATRLRHGGCLCCCPHDRIAWSAGWCRTAPGAGGSCFAGSLAGDGGARKHHLLGTATDSSIRGSNWQSWRQRQGRCRGGCTAGGGLGTSAKSGGARQMASRCLLGLA